MELSINDPTEIQLEHRDNDSTEETSDEYSLNPSPTQVKPKPSEPIELSKHRSNEWCNNEEIYDEHLLNPSPTQVELKPSPNKEQEVSEIYVFSVSPTQREKNPEQIEEQPIPENNSTATTGKSRSAIESSGLISTNTSSSCDNHEQKKRIFI